MSPYLDDDRGPFDLLSEENPQELGNEEPALPGFGQLSVVDEIEAVSTGEEAKERSKEWIGLPVFGDSRPPARAVISFETPEDCQRFFDELGIKTIHKGTRGTLSVWWPEKSREDLSSLRFVVEDLSG